MIKESVSKEDRENKGFDSCNDAFELLHEKLIRHIEAIDHCNQDSSDSVSQFPRTK